MHRTIEWARTLNGGAKNGLNVGMSSKMTKLKAYYPWLSTKY